jgi:3-hydroxyisobutyrate dehydrogenase-like beta-hydroxyacid dehydrogenase
MVKDVRLYLDEAKALGVPIDIAEAIGRLWEIAARDEGPDSDFTSVIKPLEKAAGVTVAAAGQPPGQPAV